MMSLIVMSKKTLFILSFLLSTFTVQSQNGFVKTSGWSVSFFFNSIDEIQNGITYLNFSRFDAYNQGDHVSGASWDLTVRANAVLKNGLPLEVVEVRADIAAADGTTLGWVQLDNLLGSVNLIINGAVGNNMRIDISYRVGDILNTVQMSGYPGDFYQVDLIFEMVFHP